MLLTPTSGASRLPWTPGSELDTILWHSVTFSPFVYISSYTTEAWHLKTTFPRLSCCRSSGWDWILHLRCSCVRFGGGIETETVCPTTVGANEWASVCVFFMGKIPCSTAYPPASGEILADISWDFTPCKNSSGVILSPYKQPSNFHSYSPSNNLESTKLLGLSPFLPASST